LPPHPERDLLWFIATYAPEMESWERDIFLAVREESFYFYPVYATQIMNEGWASYWHARLLREADFIPQAAYLDAIKCHSDVVRPIAAGEQVALSVNPYHLGFTLWEEIVKKSSIDAARQIMREDDDFSFLRNHLTREIATEMGLFRFQRQQSGQVKVVGGDIEALQESLLMDKFNFGAPRISVTEVRSDGTTDAGARQPARWARPRCRAGVQGIGVCQARLASTRAAQDGRRRLAAGGAFGGFGSRGLT